jgi:hypothetical protein
MIFTFFMALVATYAEPALNAMGLATEQLTNGAFKKSLLLFAVAFGVGFGVMLGVARMVCLGCGDVPRGETWRLSNMLIIGYSLAIVLTTVSRLEYVAVAWDCAGVTTSSITVPLVLAMGIGLGTELGVQDAFGLLAMGSIGPICSVLIAGLCVRLREHLRGGPSQFGDNTAENAGPNNSRCGTLYIDYSAKVVHTEDDDTNGKPTIEMASSSPASPVPGMGDVTSEPEGKCYSPTV